ncbi:hypothetical protein K437DRAFT_250373 [Tilletiaria anomala UBC 951]|uniref:Spindle pole body component n=1 Tax=Tilletiaria anomala (strain ATCC 24038 / CBS 436.72 / UBC 951) TaxID=1037660 RepID=A0A066VMG2_TILAU|nr:uncharacterized protein K437DRAFT_250373 [Tilletiaria anomala UBC 951]KDN39944.1 hypothetical protein K437DRAFT_250373 [Tilletiaria anomala UBC 951]
MATSRSAASSGRAPISGAAGSAALPPVTPAAGSKYASSSGSRRNRSLRPMSAKQLDKIQRNLVAVERSTRNRVSSGASARSEEGEEGAIDQEADAQIAHAQALAAVAAAAGSGVGIDGNGAGSSAGNRRTEEEEVLARYDLREEHYLRRPTQSSLINKLTGSSVAGTTAMPLDDPRKQQHPAAALALSRSGAAVSSRDVRGAQQNMARGRSQGAGAGAGNESFMHEASFVLNPLNRRTTAASPRHARGTSGASASTNTAVHRAKGKGKERENDEALFARTASRAANDAKQPSVTKAKEVANADTDPDPNADTDADAGLDADADTPVLPMRDMDKETQEAFILEDLLFVLQGIEGDYIHYASSYHPSKPAHALRGPRFSIADLHLDPSLRDMAERILPLATLFAAIDAFAQMQGELAFGTVAHALCAAIKDLLKEYEMLLVQLEHQFNTSASFTLQKLWFYLHPTLRTLSLVHALTADIAAISYANIFEEQDEEDDDDDDDDDGEDDNSDASGSGRGRTGSDASLERQRRALLGLDDPDDEGVEGGIVKGGEILAMLWDRVTRMSGDPSAHALYLSLFRAASQPYKATLLRWISTGQLSDPYEEFIVMEDTRVTRASLEQDPTDEYWERRYTLRDETVLAAREQLRQQGLLAFDDDDEENQEDQNAGGDAEPGGGGGVGRGRSGAEDESARGILTGGAKVPVFLEPWKQKILLAGKYLNVIRECGIDITRSEHGHGDWLVSVPAGMDESLVLNDPNFLKCIEHAYERANTTLLKLLINEQHIIQRLRSVKHYFVMEHSDFFMSFYEQSIRDLRKFVVPGRVGSIPMRLGQQLGMVLGSSTTIGSDDPYKEDLRVECNNEKVYSQLMRIAETKGGIEAAKALARQEKKDRAVQQFKVMDVLQFDIAVKFPVSLVISKKNILRWQFLQRVLLHLKILERQLVEMWSEHQESSWRQVTKGHAPLQQWKNRIFKLRHSMTFVVQQVLAFITNEIIEPGWDDLENKMANAKTVDQFMRDHFDFLNVARKQAMLTDFKYLTFHTRMTTVVEYFVDLRANFRDQLQKEKAAFEQLSPGESPSIHPGVVKFVDQVEAAWMKQSKSFRDCVILLSTTENPAATPLAHKLQAATLF